VTVEVKVNVYYILPSEIGSVNSKKAK